MKILLMSDTHGKIQPAIDVIKKLENEIDMIIHLGDYVDDAKRIKSKINSQFPFEYVPGNLDGKPNSECYKVIDSPYGNILLTHGHLDNVKEAPICLFFKIMELDCKAGFFGHTHSPFFEEDEGVYLINPGSISSPRLTNHGTYFIVTIDEEKIQHKEYTVELKTPPTSKISGKLKSMLNNSDRF